MFLSNRNLLGDRLSYGISAMRKDVVCQKPPIDVNIEGIRVASQFKVKPCGETYVPFGDLSVNYQPNLVLFNKFLPEYH